MRHPRLFDLTLLLLLVPVWIAGFVLYVPDVWRGQLARVPVYVSAAKKVDGYPIVRGFRPGTREDNAALAVGDWLAQVGNEELRGGGPWGFVTRVYTQADSQLTVPITFFHDGVQQETTLRLNRIASSPAASLWSTLPITLGFFLPALFVFIRELGSRQARAFFLACLAYSFQWMLFPGGSSWRTQAWMVIFLCSSTVMYPFVLRAVQVFPERLWPVGVHLPAWPWLFSVFGPIQSGTMFGLLPLPPGLVQSANAFVTLLFIASLLWLLRRKWNEADAIGRRQIRWVVYGFYSGTVPVFAADVVATFNPALWQYHSFAISFVGLIPFFIVLALVRYDLFDIDRLISSTATYSLLLFFLIAGFLLLEPNFLPSFPAPEASDHVVSMEPFSLQVAFLCFALVGGFLVYRSLYLRVDRWFFPERHKLAKGVQQLIEELHVGRTARQVWTLTGEQLSKLIRPEHCIVYERHGSRYASVFVSGSVIPQVFDALSATFAVFQRQVEGMIEKRWWRQMRETLSPEDRQILDQLRVELVLAIQGTSLPAAFICLGKKRSGDIYTATDEMHLKAVAQTLSETLARLQREDNPPEEPPCAAL